MKYWKNILIPGCVIVLCTAFGVFKPFSSVLVNWVLMMVILFCLLWIGFMVYKRLRSSARRSDEAIRQIVGSIAIPCALVDSQGHIDWKNRAFENLTKENQLKKILPRFDARRPQAHLNAELNGRQYDVRTIQTYNINGTGEMPVSIQYWMDRTDEEAYRLRFEAAQPIICNIQIDNYEELAQEIENSALTQVHKLLVEFAAQAKGVLRRCERGKYMLVFSKGMLAALEEDKFSVLDRVREVTGKDGIPVSLSIAVGVASQLQESARQASQAMELAQGRGGDQAVVKEGTRHVFYGGVRQSVEQHSKVKTRVIAHSLSGLMSQYESVYIVGHRQADMDCIGAAIGMAKVAKTLRKEVHIVLSKSNVTIDQVVGDARHQEEYRDLFVKPHQAMERCGQSSLLVIVDTQRVQSVELPELIPLAGAVVIIDHHRRSADALKGATLQYTQSYASSTCELVAELAQYFEPEVQLSPFDCSALLSGITIDTKNFAYNTGVRTFEAAAFLRKNGADATYVRETYQDDLETYNNRSKVVEKSTEIAAGVRISACLPEMPHAALLAAQAADELVNIKNVQAAFVLAHTEQGISVSGRSAGSINVQLVLEKLGGGGHQNIAGAQLDGADLEQARAMVCQAVEEYLEETRKENH